MWASPSSSLGEALWLPRGRSLIGRLTARRHPPHSPIARPCWSVPPEDRVAAQAGNAAGTQQERLGVRPGTPPEQCGCLPGAVPTQVGLPMTTSGTDEALAGHGWARMGTDGNSVLPTWRGARHHERTQYPQYPQYRHQSHQPRPEPGTTITGTRSGSYVRPARRGNAPLATTCFAASKHRFTTTCLAESRACEAISRSRRQR